MSTIFAQNTQIWDYNIQVYKHVAQGAMLIWVLISLPQAQCVGELLSSDTHTHPFHGPLSRTTQVSRYQKGKTNLDFTEARDSEWQWHHMGHMQVCTSFLTDNHTSTPPLKFFLDRMPYLLPNQQRQSTEGTLLDSQKK